MEDVWFVSFGDMMSHLGTGIIIQPIVSFLQHVALAKSFSKMEPAYQVDTTQVGFLNWSFELILWFDIGISALLILNQHYQSSIFKIFLRNFLDGDCRISLIHLSLALFPWHQSYLVQQWWSQLEKQCWQHGSLLVSCMLQFFSCQISLFIFLLHLLLVSLLLLHLHYFNHLRSKCVDI